MELNVFNIATTSLSGIEDRYHELRKDISSHDPEIYELQELDLIVAELIRRLAQI